MADPAAFEYEAEAINRPGWEVLSGGWVLFGEHYPTNPKHLLCAADYEMLALWQHWRMGGMAAGHLPEAGGMMQQPAAMLEAFNIMNAALAQLKKEAGKDGG